MAILVRAESGKDTPAVNYCAGRRRNIGLGLLLAAWLACGCDQAYDVTARLSGGTVRLVSVPSRPSADSQWDATVFIGGARIQVARDGSAFLQYADGTRLPLAGKQPIPPFPQELREKPGPDSVGGQVVTAELFLSQLLRPLPTVLVEQIESGDPAGRPAQIALARELSTGEQVVARGGLGRWWSFVLAYQLRRSDRERLAAAVGSAAAGPATQR